MRPNVNLDLTINEYLVLEKVLESIADSSSGLEKSVVSLNNLELDKHELKHLIEMKSRLLD